MSRCVDCRREMSDSEAKLFLECPLCRKRRKTPIPRFTERWRNKPGVRDRELLFPVQIGDED